MKVADYSRLALLASGLGGDVLILTPTVLVTRG